MSATTTVTETRSSSIEFAPKHNVSILVNIISILRTIYIFFVKENLFFWRFFQGTRNPRADIEGPFYVIGAPNRNIGQGKGVLATLPDLRQFKPFLFKLTIQDPKGEPIPGANIDLWQATTAGHYFFRTYRLRGQFTTDENGKVEILTIAPGKYGPPKLQRAGHFHIIINDPNGRFDQLTTQVYVCQANQSSEMESDFANYARAHRPQNMLVSWSIPSAMAGDGDRKALMDFPELASEDVDTQSAVKWWNERLAEKEQGLEIAGGGETVIRMNTVPSWSGML